MSSPHYLVALSGGADSVALLLYLLERGEAGAAAHMNFRLRGEESDRDEAFVRDLCERRGVRLFVKTVDTLTICRETGEGIEEAARRLRYAWFAELCTAEGLTAVAVGHHLEDRAETLLLNLVRGAGLRGLSAMGEERTDVVRPLIDWSRKAVEAFVEQHGERYVTDSTNADTAYRRNYVRHVLLPALAVLNPAVDRTLSDTTVRLAQSQQLVTYALEHLRREMVTPLADGFRIDLGKLLASPAPQTILHEWLAPQGFTPREAAEALTLRRGGLIGRGDWLLTRTGEQLEVRRRPEAFAPYSFTLDFERRTLHVPGGQIVCAWASPDRVAGMDLRNPNLCAIDADRLAGQQPLTLTLRRTMEGDRFVPYGMRGSRLVSDYLTDRHRSRIDKLAAFVLTDAEGIIWLVGERPAARVAFSPSTCRYLTFTFIPS